MRTVTTLVAAFGLFLLLALAGWAMADKFGSQTPHYSQAQREQAKQDAEIYCTLGGVVGPNGPQSLYDPAYLNCVRQETQNNLESGEYGPKQ